MMTAQEIDDFCERGRVFYETFPGTAASDEWRRHSAFADSIPTDLPTRSGHDDDDDPATSTGSDRIRSRQG